MDFDDKPDHIWEYIVPYYSQDKGIAYNLDNSIRSHLKKLNELKEELEDKSTKLSWEQIINVLKEHNYERFAWTDAYYDNLMISSIYQNNIEYNKITDKNYKSAINYFVDFVEKVSGNSIQNTEYNFISDDGLLLADHLIEPKQKRSDAAILYNGDALDAYYSNDNYKSIKSNMIRFIRPKENFMLLDCWIISKNLFNEYSNKSLKTLSEYAYTQKPNILDPAKGLQDLEINFLKEIREKISSSADIINEEKNRLQLENNLNEYDATIKINNFINKIKLIESNPNLINEY